MRNEISHARIGIIGAMQVEVDLLIQAMRSQGAVSRNRLLVEIFMRETSTEPLLWWFNAEWAWSMQHYAPKLSLRPFRLPLSLIPA